MRFEEGYSGWQEGHLTQKEAGRLLGMSERNFRRYVERYQEEGEAGLIDRRLTQASSRCAPVDEVLQLTDLYASRYNGWNVKHFHSFYRREHDGTRSYTWVKKELQKAGLVRKAKGKGKHRKQRERAPMEGMMLHQDGSTHAWVPGVKWDLIITLDDATSTHSRCSSSMRRERHPASGGFVMSLKCMASHQAFTVIVAATTGTRRRQTARWIKAI